MCGISGFFSVEPVVQDSEEAGLIRMRAALAHRGPDGSGVRYMRHAAFAHNRLAIIDPAAGVQPLTDPAGLVTIVFNGEIYNYRELRTRYAGFDYRTQSDTEVIVAIYMRDGIDGLVQLRGMFAIALWDARSSTGWLIRDPVGIKPLFVLESSRRLYFASEAKAILAGRASKPRLNMGALHQLLNFRYLTGDDSLFEDIHQVPPGQVIEWQADGRMRRWTPSWPSSGQPGIRDAFSQAVSRHLVADVDVGCFLSGGIDSAMIASQASRSMSIQTFTLNAGDDPRESSNAAETAALLGLPNTVFEFAMPDVVAFHKSLVKHLEVPKVNAVQSAILAEHTARHSKVALSGLGGDEIFLGYNAHRIMWAAKWAGRFTPMGSNRFAARLLSTFMEDQIPWGERTRALTMLAAIPGWSRVYGVLRNVWDSPAMRRQVYADRMLDSRMGDSFEWLGTQFPEGAGGVEGMREFEFRHKMVNDLLWNEDRVSMRAGLEVRVPFLDWDLVGACRALSARELMPQGRTKYLLKKMAQEMLPESVVRRPKSGFQIDVVGASESTLAPLFDAYLSEEVVKHHGLFNPAFIADVRSHRHDRRWRWHYFLLYLMAQTHILMDEYEFS